MLSYIPCRCIKICWITQTYRNTGDILDDTEDDEKNGETIDLSKPDKNIDDIFIQIKNLYNTRDFIVIYNILKMMSDDPSNYDDYMKGFNQIFEPKNNLIRKWINDNIVF